MGADFLASSQSVYLRKGQGINAEEFQTDFKTRKGPSCIPIEKEENIQ